MAIAGRFSGACGFAGRPLQNWHHANQTTAPMKTKIETQALSRRPAMCCAGSIRSSSSKTRPNVYQAT